MNEQKRNKREGRIAGLVTTAQAALRLGISPRAVTGHVERGNLRATKVGTGYLFTEADLTRFERRRRGVGRPLKDPQAGPVRPRPCKRDLVQQQGPASSDGPGESRGVGAPLPTIRSYPTRDGRHYDAVCGDVKTRRAIPPGSISPRSNDSETDRS